MADVKVEQRHRQAVWDIFERLKPAGYDLSPEEICDRDGWIVSGAAPDADVATVFSGIAQALANAESAKAEAQPAGTGWVTDGSLPDEGRSVAFWWGSTRPEIGVRKGDMVMFADCAIDVTALKLWLYLPPPPAQEPRE